MIYRHRLNNYKNSPGRPLIGVDLELIVQLHNNEGFGWLKGAEEYCRRTGKWVSKAISRVK